jgi:hypothetical protein
LLPTTNQSALSGAPDDVRVNIARFENEFHKITFLPLMDGIERTVAWQRELYK